MQTLVLDTNIVLDVWVFQDPGVAELSETLQSGGCPWIATSAMRDELSRVLGYPAIDQRLKQQSKSAQDVLRQFDALTCLVDTAPKAPITCKDPDDQKFIDLAVAHQAWLFSKDKAVMAMKKRLQVLGCALNPALTNGGCAKS